MDDCFIEQRPGMMNAILADTGKLGFTMASAPKTGSLLRLFAASKPHGRFLELGTGTGIGSAWLLSGMDANARLDTVDSDPAVQEIAARHLSQDPRVHFHMMDGAAFLESARQEFDFMPIWKAVKDSHRPSSDGLRAS